MRAKSYKLCKTATGDYEHVVKYDEFIVVNNWYTNRAKRLNSLFAKNPADPDAVRIWKRCQVDFGIADTMYNLNQQHKLRFI